MQKGPGRGAGSLLPAADQVIGGWLDDLKDSGNGLLETLERSRLRGLCRRWLASGTGQPSLDGMLRGCSPSDTEAAARALRKRTVGGLPASGQTARARRLFLGLSRALREAARSTTSSSAAPSRKPSTSPASLTHILSDAAGTIQAARSITAIARALLDGALRLSGASSAIWWEQEDGSMLYARLAKGLRLPRKGRAASIARGFWKPAARGAAARHRQLIQLSADRPEHIPLLRPARASGGLLIRVTAAGESLGALAVYNGTFDQERANLLVTLAQHAALALRARRIDSEPRQLALGHRRATADIGLALSSSLDLDKLLQVVCRSATELLGADCCFLFLSDDDGPLRLRARRCNGQACRNIPERALLAAAEHTRAQTKGRLLWRAGRRMPLAAAAPIQEGGIQALLGLALNVRGQPVGALLLLDSTRRAFSAERRHLVASFAAQATVAIENVQLVEDMQRRLLEMADLTWVSTRVTSTLDAHNIAATVTDAAAKALNVPRVALFTAGADGRYEPIPGGQLGLPDQRQHALPSRDHVGAEAISTNAPQSVADAVDEGLQQDLLVQWLTATSLLCVPMTARQGLRGLFVVGDDRPRTFQAHEVALLSAYGGQTALALQSAILYENVVGHLGQLGDLLDVSQTVSSSLELPETLQRVLDSASDLLGAPLASLMLMDPGSGDLIIRAARGLEPDGVLYSPLKPGEGLAGRVAQSGRPLVSADISRDGRFKHRERAREVGLRAAMAAPLIARGRTVGVLNLYRQSYQQFTEDDEKLVMLLANSVAVAIDNARLYEESQERGQFLASMMGEINHRVRNTLQAIAGLLRMEIDHPGHRSTEDALRRGIARLQSVAVVHDLMPAQEVQFVDMKQAASRIAGLASQSVSPECPIQTRVSGARVMLPSQLATSVAMILSELIDNAARHGLAGRDDGLISISLAEGGGDVVIEVRDNGVGIPDTFDVESTSGMGLKVVRGIVEQDLDGKLEIEMQDGLTVRARFAKRR